MNKKTFAFVALLVLAALFFSVNLASGALFRSWRLDMTEDDLYTLSDGSRNILANMQEPVTLRFFYSDELVSTSSDAGVGSIKDYAQRVRELLDEFANAAGDKLELLVIDPERFSEEEDEASTYGLRGVPANLAGDPVYFGLAGSNSIDEEEVIEFFRQERQEFLEYDIAQLVYKLSRSSKTIVGLMSTLPIEGGGFNPMNPGQPPPPAWLIVDQIRQLSEVRSVPTSATSIEADIDVLVLVHPKGLSDATLFALDQFVLGGGRLIAFLDPWCESDPIPQDPNNPLAGVSADRSSDLDPLLASWGVELVKDRIAGDKGSAMVVGYRGQPVDYVVYLELDGERMSKDDTITSELKRVVMATAGVLRPLDGATTTFTPLMETTEDSMEVDRINVALNTEPARLYADFVSTGKKMALAARLSGPAKTAFPEGEPAKPEEEQPEDFVTAPTEDGALTEGEVNVLLIADADMLQDRFWTEEIRALRLAIPRANNADLLINAIDTLSGSDDLISLRSRPSFGRPFEVVADLRRKAEDEFRAQEKLLEEKLREIETRLRELQSQRDESVSSMLILTPEQQAEIEHAREEQIATRKELRKVQHSLNKSIESLGFWVKAWNIAIVPFGIGLAALLVFFLRAGARKSS